MVQLINSPGPKVSISFLYLFNFIFRKITAQSSPHYSQHQSVQWKQLTHQRKKTNTKKMSLHGSKNSKVPKCTYFWISFIHKTTIQFMNQSHQIMPRTGQMNRFKLHIDPFQIPLFLPSSPHILIELKIHSQVFGPTTTIATRSWTRIDKTCWR